MKIAVVVLESPYNHEAADSSFNFIQSALRKGHQIQGVFFYCDGIHNAVKDMDPPQDDRHIAKRWASLGEQGIDMVVCIAASKRRGVKDDRLTPGFRISGLGQLAGMIRDADRVVTFGD